MTNPTLCEPCARGDGLALIAGAGLPLAFAPTSAWPLAVFCPALLFGLLACVSPRVAFRRGLAFGIGMFGVGVSWVYVAVHDFGHTGAVPATLLTGLFVAILSLYPALFGYVGARLRDKLRLGDGPYLVLLLPALWVGFEWLRATLFTGFPWLQLGYAQVDAPLAGWAPVGGVYALSLAAALTAGVLADLLYRHRRAAWAWGLPLVAVLWLGGMQLSGTAWTRPAGAPLTVALVQGNQPQATKWDPAQVKRRLDAYADLTTPLLGGKDLVIWPENSLTMFYHQLEEYLGWLEGEAADSGTDVVLGLPVMDTESRDYYASMAVLGAGAPQFYHKRHLVPFGEFVPFQDALRGLIGFFDLPMSSFSPGPQSPPPMTVAGQSAAFSVCYEDAFGEEVLYALPEATLLINGSNNAWYGDSLAPHQHLQISRMRALETGRPLLRATTTGVTALVGPDGKVTARAPQFESTVLEGEVQPMTGRTPFIGWGNTPALGLVLGIGVFAAVLGHGLRGREEASAAVESE